LIFIEELVPPTEPPPPPPVIVEIVPKPVTVFLIVNTPEVKTTPEVAKQRAIIINAYFILSIVALKRTTNEYKKELWIIDMNKIL